MDVPPERPSPAQQAWPRLRRTWFGVLAIGMAVFGVWLAAVAMLMLWGLHCDDTATWQDRLYGLLACGVIAALASLPWLAAVSFVRLAAGRAGLLQRTWIAGPMVVAAVSVAYLGVIPTPPPGSESCRLDLN